MKKIIYNITAIAIIVLLISNISCTNESAIEIEDNTNALTLNLDFSRLETRALATEPGDDDGDFNENKIVHLDIFFYDGNILKWHVSNSDITFDNVSNKATLPISANKRALFENNSSTTYDIYVVANNTADLSSITEEANNLSQLKDLVFQTTDFVTKGGESKQTSFVMDGKVSKIVNINNPDLGTVNLKRAAAKIRLNVASVNVAGYSASTNPISARLVNFTDKSTLMNDGALYSPNSGDWKTTQSRVVNTNIGSTGKTTAAPFYAYANDWRTDGDKESYIELYIPLKHNATSTEQTYKYYIPLTPQSLTGDDAIYMNNLQRNLLYDIEVLIKILGSVEEPPVEVSGNYVIKDWTTQEVLVDIKGSHYLVVSENYIVMPNITEYTINFNSSIADVKLVPNSLKATYTYVKVSTGLEVTESATGNQIPTITVQPNVASGTIKISSTVPINFIPKDIEFKVTNGTLTETIVVRQLPPTYYTAERGEKSIRRDDFNSSGDSHLNNRYMYAITTLASDGQIVWGFPPLDNNGHTANTAEVANMVSPKFMMASQLGATPVMAYNSGTTNAVKNCKDYWEETKINGVTVRYDDWRLPTEAEIKYIDGLQHNPNNPQGLVMTGRYYWDAYSNNGAYKMFDQSSTTTSSAQSAHVRCIRDIKD